MARFKDTTVQSLQFGDNVSDGNLIDSLNSAGTDGQVLVSTGTGFEWRTVGTQAQSRYITVFGAIAGQALPSQGLATTPETSITTTIDLDQTLETSGDFNVLPAGGVQVNDAGIYLVSYSCLARGITSNTFDQSGACFQLNVNNSYVVGSRTYCSTNNATGGSNFAGQGVAAKTIILNLSVGDAVTVQGANATEFNSIFGLTACDTTRSTLTLYSFI